MKKVVIALFVLSISGIVTSCKKEYLAFPHDLRAYFPYVENQEITFVNDSNHLMSGKVLEIVVEETEYLPYTCKCGDVHNRNMYFTIHSENFSIYGTMATRISTLKMVCSCKFRTGTTHDIDMEKEFNGDPFSGNFSKTVGDTVVLEKGNDRMVVIKGKGISEVKAGDDVWRLKE